MWNDFSYAAYKRLIQTLLKDRANVCFKDFSGEPPRGNILLLRHDVDFSPEAALQMAEIETELGIKATYFVLLTCPYYNLLSADYIGFPQRLIELGHEVGLHYDMRIFELPGKTDPMELLTAQCTMLSQISGSEIVSISMHNPSLSGADPFREIPDFINAYAPRFTSDISYFSDSCGAWKDEFVSCAQQGHFPPAMQLLIHPIFWGEDSEIRWIRLDRYIHGKIHDLLHSALLVKKLWAQHPGVMQHERRKHVNSHSLQVC